MEAEHRREYLASAAYQERHQRLVEWEQKRRAAEAYQRFRAQEREGYNATAGVGKSPTTTPTPTPTSTPAPMCTVPPQPQTYIGPAPTGTPTPTPVPPLTGQDVARGVCEAADLVDPVMPDPATVGGPDVGDLIDQAYVWQQSIPVVSPQSEMIVRTFVRLPIMTAKVFKDGPATVVNFICQQRDKTGPYYEMFPLDQKVQSVKDWWNKMDNKQKASILGYTILALMIAIPVIIVLLG